MKNDLKPLPEWKQWWRRSRDRRVKALITFKALAGTLVTLAISVLGAMLISLGVYEVYPPAGLIVGGVLIWALQWSHEVDRGNKA